MMASDLCVCVGIKEVGISIIILDYFMDYYTDVINIITYRLDYFNIINIRIELCTFLYIKEFRYIEAFIS